LIFHNKTQLDIVPVKRFFVPKSKYVEVVIENFVLEASTARLSFHLLYLPHQLIQCFYNSDACRVLFNNKFLLLSLSLPGCIMLCLESDIYELPITISSLSLSLPPAALIFQLHCCGSDDVTNEKFIVARVESFPNHSPHYKW
jgi:hypothetical protein